MRKQNCRKYKHTFSFVLVVLQNEWHAGMVRSFSLKVYIDVSFKMEQLLSTPMFTNMFFPFPMKNDPLFPSQLPSLRKTMLGDWSNLRFRKYYKMKIILLVSNIIQIDCVIVSFWARCITLWTIISSFFSSTWLFVSMAFYVSS